MDKFVAEGENEMSEKELNDDKLQHGDLTVLDQFFTTKVENVASKSSYLFDVMNTYKKTNKAVPGHSVDGQNATQVPVRGLNEKKIKQLTDRTGYNLEVTTGQRKYGGPPPGWEGQPPGVGCEVFCGKVPKDVYEDELVPLFETCGRIWDLRLMMNPLTGSTRGYAFVTFTNREEAQKAVQELENYEIRHGKNLKINISVPNLRLFVGNIPKSKGKEEILEEFGKLTAGLVDVIIYSSPDDKKKNRGFCFLEYESHKAASIAKRRLGTGRVKIWRCSIIVDWADPQEEPDEQRMSKVKVLYARNLTQEITEEKLKEEFEAFGKVERVKKIKDYAFIHFEDRDQAVKAMESLDSKELGGSNIEVTLAKPPSDKKKKEEILRARERRMMQVKKSMMPGAYPPRGQGDSRAGIMRLPPIGRVDYDFNDYRGSYIDPYFDDFAYYDFPPTLSPPRGRGARLLPPKLEEPGIPGGFYDFSSGSQSSRGRGQVPRGSTGIRRARRGGSTRGTRRTMRPGGRGMSRPRST